MKKHFLLLSFFVFAVTFCVFAKKIDIRNAQLVAKNFYYEQINQKVATPYQAIAVTNQFTEKVNNEPVYYVFTVNDHGFVIISADDAVTPVIGFSFSSAFLEDNQPENFTGWMEHYSKEVQYVQQHNISATTEITDSWNHLLTTDLNSLTIHRGTTDVEPLLINIEWDQTFPYNAMCPADAAGPDGHTLVGCVATAMSQIMCYWRYPNTGLGYHCIFPTPSYGSQCADFSNTTYDWNAAANKPDKECELAALISYHAGIAVDMDYGTSASGAVMYKVAPAFKNYFQYASTAQVLDRYSDLNSWKTLLKGDIDNGQPVQYAGSSTSSGGHSWVCDGYQGTDYFHMNWGWSGSANGYFTLNALNPSGENFNSGQQACVHIKPDPAQYPSFCTGTNHVTTSDFGMIEDGSGPFSNYQANANCSWLINIDDSVRTITLSFDRFALNATDFVKVYDGIDASATLLGSFSGTTVPSSLTSTSSKMFITFTSASGSSAQGFLASYTTALNNFCSNNTVLTSATGSFGDGSGRFLYRNGQSCRWTIQPPNATSVTVTFNNFSTEQGKDLMKIYDVTNTTTPLAIISGDYTTPPQAVTSPSSGMMVMFISNKSVRGQGWSLNYSITVGTDDSKTFENLSVYPNPCSGLLNVDFTMSNIQKVKIELISVQGSVMFTNETDNFKGKFHKQLDLSSLTKGIYMLRVTSDQGVTTKKIFLQ
jgi:hypothetical protein